MLPLIDTWFRDHNLYLPSPPPRPNIHHLVLPPLAPTVHDQIPIKARARDAAVIRPDFHPLSILQRDLVFGFTIPHQDAMFLGDFAHLPTGVNTGKVRTWGGVRGEVTAPGHKKAPAGVIHSGDAALVGDGFSAEGEAACVDEGFGGGVFAAGGVEGGYFC